MKRSDSSVRQFVQRIPLDVRSLAIGRTLTIPLGAEKAIVTITPSMTAIRFSLRTQDRSEAKARHGQAAAYLETFWAALRRSKPIELDHRQATALAGDLYRGWADAGADRTIAVTHTPNGWVRDRLSPEEERLGFESAIASLEDAMQAHDPAALEAPLGPIVQQLLLAKGITSVDPGTWALLLETFAPALRDAFDARKRNAAGDYSPDPNAARFPLFEAPVPQPSKRPEATSSAKTSLTQLVEDWWTEARAAGKKRSTHESYRNTMANFAAFLKHDDARRVTPESVIDFKNHRIASINPRTGRPISAKTVNDSDLSGLKTIFEWAVGNRRMASNPAKGLKVRVGKPQKLRSKGFSEAEAVAILRAALDYSPRSEQPRTAAAKRWVPWLQAYTGARVGEMGQLRKEDLRHEAGHWVITITPEAGTVKTNEARDVVLHAHLIELGFVSFVGSAAAGPLFLKPSAEGDVLGPLRGLKNRLAEFAREIVPDSNVAPTHGWRHRFKTVGREAGIDSKVLDAIQGQAPETVADSYGDFTVKTKAAAIAKVPRIEIGLVPPVRPVP